MKVSVKIAKKGIKEFRRAGLVFTPAPRELSVVDEPEKPDEIAKEQLAQLKAEKMLKVETVKEAKK